MAPPVEELEAALIDAACQVYRDDPDAISVNKVRQHAENRLDLDDDFFSSGDWKQKSKALIKEYVDKLLDGWTPDDAPEQKKAKNGTKRSSSAADPPEPKRLKRAAQPQKSVKKQIEDESSELSELEDEPEPKPKTAADRRMSKEIDPDIQSSPASSPASKRKGKPRAKSAFKAEATKASKRKQSAEPDEVKSEGSEVNPENERKQSPDESMRNEQAAKPKDSNAVVDEEEEYSDVIDEPPHPKRKKKDRKDSTSKQPKTTKKSSAPSNEDPDQAEIKKLQSQLVKCGIRKLWHNELKKYGDDARAKIRHLKKMLADVGMDGRFSEAKAREIKESRELMAEMEAAQEMNRLWGKSSQGRASRSTDKAKNLEESEKSEADDDEEEESNTFAARRRRAQADLAFLGDDSDSD